MKRKQRKYADAMREAEVAFWSGLISKLPHATLRELADAAGCAPSTVMRRLRLLGFRAEIQWKGATP